jgi:signal transduction histidine kinase
MILDGSFGELTVDAREALERILQSSKRLVVIVEDFMNISKIEKGEINYNFSKVDLNKITQEVVEDAVKSAQESGLKINFNTDGSTNYFVMSDAGKIRQVISNLIDNSIKYTPHGSINVSLENSDDGNIILKISDTGIGMAPETINKIFKKFSRAKEASKFHTGGSGLGLFVAKEIVKAHKGRIWAQSPGLGKGSVFCVELKTV